MSPALAEFYKDLDSWLKHDTDAYRFRPDQGLCDNLDDWATEKGYDPQSLNRELLRQFEAAGLNTTYPFNRDHDDYDRESIGNNTYVNKVRLNWIRARMQQIERDKTMSWTVNISYEGKEPGTIAGRSSTSHAIDPVEAIKQSLDRINRMRGGKPVSIVSISVTRDS